MSNGAPFLANAIAAAKRGLRVLPLSPRSKIPLPGTRGLNDASDDVAQITAWWTNHPQANIALRTGQRARGGSGFVAIDIDIDPGKGVNGAEIWDILCDINGEPSATPTVITPRGGKHIYFAHPDGLEVNNSAGKIGKEHAAKGKGSGIDVRADGGYVVAPPSVLSNGEYIFDVSMKYPLAPLPGWLLEMLVPVPAPDTVGLPGKYPPDAVMPIGADPSEKAGGIIPAGRRHNEMVRLAGMLRRKGHTAEMIFGSLCAANRAYCVPKLSAQELNNIAESIQKYPSATSILSNPTGKRLKLSTPSQIKARPRPKWLIDKLFITGTIACIAGHPGTWKSFAALDMALCVATGKPFQGHSVSQAPVVYIVAEGADLFGDRLAAWELEHGITAPDSIRFIEEPVNMHDDIEVQNLLTEIKAMEHPPKLIVVDTLAWCFGEGREENSKDDMQQYLATCNLLKRETGACVLSLHHLTKSKDDPTARGSGALKAGIDTMFMVTRSGDCISLANGHDAGGKQKDAAELEQPLVLRMREVEWVQHDDQGNEQYDEEGNLVMGGSLVFDAVTDQAEIEKATKNTKSPPPAWAQRPVMPQVPQKASESPAEPIQGELLP